MSRFLVADCRIINCGAENNSWIKPNWWMSLSGGSEGAEDMLYDTCTVTTFPGLEDGLQVLCCCVWCSHTTAWLMSTQMATVDFLHTLFIQERFAEREGSFSTNTTTQTHMVTHSYPRELPSISLTVACRGGSKAPHGYLGWSEVHLNGVELNLSQTSGHLRQFQGYVSSVIDQLRIYMKQGWALGLTRKEALGLTTWFRFFHTWKSGSLSERSFMYLSHYLQLICLVLVSHCYLGRPLNNVVWPMYVLMWALSTY